MGVEAFTRSAQLFFFDFNGDLNKLNGVMGVARVRDIGPRPIMDKFVARYTKEYNQPVATSENILNYCAMRILAAAMESAGTTEDLLAIKTDLSGGAGLPGPGI